MTAQIRITYPDGRTEERTLPFGTYVAGREAGDIVLGDPNTSGRHAQIDVQPGRVTITDLGSTNGTYDMQGQRLSAPYMMIPDQPIRLGTTTVTLLPPQKTAAGTHIMPQVPGGMAMPGVPMPGAPPYSPPVTAPYVQPGQPQPGAPFGQPPGAAPDGQPVGGPVTPGAPIGGAAPFPTLGAITPGAEAVWGSRAVGFLIDYCFVMAVMIVLTIAFTLVSSLVAGATGAVTAAAGAAGPAADDAAAAALGMFSSSLCAMLVIFPLAALAVGAYNRVYLVSKRGYSIGQGVMKLKVVDTNGALLPMGTAAIRLLAQVGLSMVPLAGVLDLLWPLWDPRHQTLHDKAIGSFVIPDPLRK